MSEPPHLVVPVVPAVLTRSEISASPSTPLPPLRGRAGTVSPPIDLAPLEGTSPVVAAGLAALLTTYASRVRFQHPGRPADVVVADLTQRSGPLRVPVVSAALVVLVRDGDRRAFAEARSAGAEPLSIAAPAKRIVQAVEDAHRHGPGRHRDPPGPTDPPPVPVSSPSLALSPREVEVVTGICAGLSNVEIADQLFVSINSIKTYVRSAYRKMGVERRGQAVVWGMQHGYGVARPARG